MYTCSKLTSPPLVHSLVVGLAMVTVTVMLVLEEEVLVAAVDGERTGCNAQTGEAALESIPPREGALVSPGLATIRQSMGLGEVDMRLGAHVRSQGSYRGWPVASLKARMLKPVMLGLGPRAAARRALPGVHH